MVQTGPSRIQRSRPDPGFRGNAALQHQLEHFIRWLARDADEESVQYLQWNANDKAGSRGRWFWPYSRMQNVGLYVSLRGRVGPTTPEVLNSNPKP